MMLRKFINGIKGILPSLIILTLNQVLFCCLFVENGGVMEFLRVAIGSGIGSTASGSDISLGAYILR